MRISIILITLFISNVSLASRILFLFPTPSKSHMIIVHALSITLAEKGHQVTVISNFSSNKNITNHREIVVNDEKSSELMNGIVSDGSSMFKIIRRAFFGMMDAAEDMIDSDQFKSLLNEEFDFLIIGMSFHNFLLGYGDHFKCPTAILSVQRHMTHTSVIIGNPLSINIARHFGATINEMNFIARVKNFAFYVLDFMLFQYATYHQKLIYE